jgi:hypothetical protein
MPEEQHPIMINKATSTPLGRAVVSFNLLACLLALAAATQHVQTFPTDTPWWGFLLSVAIVAIAIALPFLCFVSAAFEGASERVRYFVIVLNLIFSVIGAFNLYYVLHQQLPLEAMPLFAIGLTPVALANAALLVFMD